MELDQESGEDWTQPEEHKEESEEEPGTFLFYTPPPSPDRSSTSAALSPHNLPLFTTPPQHSQFPRHPGVSTTITWPLLIQEKEEMLPLEGGPHHQPNHRAYESSTSQRKCSWLGSKCWVNIWRKGTTGCNSWRRYRQKCIGWEWFSNLKGTSNGLEARWHLFN
ncbi:hypothetical protein I204_08543 [Kwoniella mangroviensis CBS 8886]|nr:hypothetical protein I204_08543 [Kwoniella mangroviensis CBS 8886]